MNDFSVQRLAVARLRRQMKGKALAEASGTSEVHMSRIAKGVNVPSEQKVHEIAKALRFPASFFYGDDVEMPQVPAVSFRSLSSMSASERDAALAAAALGFIVSDWVDDLFKLPENTLEDLRDVSPEIAAAYIRRAWRLGEKPIPNMVKLLESKGVRVFSLAENTMNVDAFSLWRSGRPFIFLNTQKSAERSRFDAAHELGHLLLHRHSNLNGDGKDVEMQANAFASAFLMPERDVLANLPQRINEIRALVIKKGRWRVSVFALLYRIHKLGRISDWNYRKLIMELTSLGYRNTEPLGIEREISTVWDRVFRELWKKRITKQQIAKQLSLPLDELENLVFGLLKKPQSEVRLASGELEQVSS